MNSSRDACRYPLLIYATERHNGICLDAADADSIAEETTPLKVGDSLYLCTPKNIIISLDPKTGKENWRYDPEVPDENIPYTATCRGLAYHSVPGMDSAQLCAIGNGVTSRRVPQPT
ncbi:hypothetical protein OLZ32_35435 [Rhizobium sp. 1AS11]|uniref:hypothetical protein n=1 Tax=Rhizobium acaciae TaxID=2989736 RepID=UPI0002D53D06|nr:hypothetical protein [Rhizobium acaciae]MCW1414080.1 hypothetical protein [Rhizobium acaciae]MCW1745659.1 hypothetical protein [Rhizobium acaciae]